MEEEGGRGGLEKGLVWHVSEPGCTFVVETCSGAGALQGGVCGHIHIPQCVGVSTSSHIPRGALRGDAQPIILPPIQPITRHTSLHNILPFPSKNGGGAGRLLGGHQFKPLPSCMRCWDGSKWILRLQLSYA